MLESTGVAGLFHHAVWLGLQPYRMLLSVSGKQNIPRSGPAIIVANHISAFDPFKIGPHLPASCPVHWLGKSELFSVSALQKEYRNFGVLSWLVAATVVTVVRSSPVIPVDRKLITSRTNIYAFKAVIDNLTKGKIIGIFPEGGVGRRYELHPAFVSLAMKTGAPIYPVALSGSGVNFLDPVVVDGSVKDKSVLAKEVLQRIYLHA